jgi:hypothetical protein
MKAHAPSAAAASVAVIADDLIWSSRLRAAVERAGGHPVALRPERLAAEATGLVIVDLTGRSFDGIGAVEAAARAGATVIAVGQHEDVDLRKRAIAAGAQRVYSYNKMFTDGPALIARWLGQPSEGDAD